MDRRKAGIATVLILLIGLATWSLGWIGGTDQAVAELKQLRDQMSDRNLPDAQRQQLRDDFRARLQTLSDDERRAFFENGRQFWMQRSEVRMDEFFAKPPLDQQRQLDEMLSRMAARRSQVSANGQQPRAAGQRGGRGGGNRASMTDAQRDERAKRRLDRSSPKMRAQFAEFRRRLNERAEQRGLNPGDLPGRFPRSGGWREQS